MGEALIPILTIAGTALGAVGSISQGQAQARAAERNADLAELEAAQTLATARENEARQERENRLFLGAQRAAIGASGITLEGSPLDVIADTAATLALEEAAIRFQGMLDAGFLRSQAEIDRLQARQARIGGFAGAGTTILTGASRLAPGFGQSGDNTVPREQNATALTGTSQRVGLGGFVP